MGSFKSCQEKPFTHDNYHLVAPIRLSKKEPFSIFFFLSSFLKNTFVYLIYVLYLAALDLRCCARAFSSCGARGLGVQASVVVARVLSSCGAWA